MESVAYLAKWLRHNNIPLDTASIKAFVDAWIENDKEESSKESNCTYKVEVHYGPKHHVPNPWKTLYT